MVNFCVFSLLPSNMRHENHLEIFPYGEPPLPTGKLGKLTPPSPLENLIPSVGVVWIFSGTTDCQIYFHSSSQRNRSFYL